MTTSYYALTLDPLHIGAGGYRLGRVDNTIIREPGTNLPKVPGSSISGVCRNYAIYQLPEDDQKKVLEECLKVNADKEEQKKDLNNCGKCVICRTFGFSNGSRSESQIGRVKFFDAQILAFPISSMTGPKWITTAPLWQQAGGRCQEPQKEQLLLNQAPPAGNRLNLGWLYLEAQQDTTLALPPLWQSHEQEPAFKEMLKNIVIVPTWLFSELVNANLEVRTSVSIDFATGAAADGALFTYEAIPRATLLSFDVVIDRHRCGNQDTAQQAATLVDKGLQLITTLGMGGMNTRGFGRLQLFTSSQGV